MSQSFRRIPISASLLFALVANAPLTAQASDSVAAVDQIFRWATANTPGCAVGVERDGRSVLTRAYGMANLSAHAPFTIETVSDAGSASKQFTAAALLLLVQDNKVGLDDDVRRYIRELPDYGTPILVRHLLSHTSGIRETDILTSLNGWGIPEAAYSNADLLDMVVRQKGLNFRPGSEFDYSNSNFLLAAVIVRRVSGMTLAEFTKQRLFDPLGMAKTHWRQNPSPVVDGMAVGYSTDAKGGISETLWPDYTNGPGGLRTTVPDLLKWNEALRRGTVVPRTVVSLMETPAQLSSGARTRYGFGLSVGSYNGVAEIQHGGMWAGYRSFVARYPEQALSVAVLCNDRTRDAAGLAHRVVDLFLPRNAKPAQTSSTPKGIALPPEKLDAAAGLYRSTRYHSVVRLSAKDGGWQYSGDISFESGMLIPSSPTTFTFGDVVSGDFRVDSRGAVRGFRMWVRRAGADTAVYERTEEWRLTAQDTAAIIGRYRSDEAGTMIVGVRNGQFFIQVRPGAVKAATPVYRDALETSMGILVFQRDDQGKVTGFSFNYPTALGIVYARQ